MPVDRIERITNLRRGELERMQAYMGSQDCLMQFLAEELNDPDAGPCGKCVNCAGRLRPEDYPSGESYRTTETLAARTD
jgi:ATP-dependent DNA helicase RecQ